MENVPRMSRVRRRHLMQLGRKSGDPDTMLRFVAVAQLGLGKKSPEVARDLAVARSTVVKAAKAFASEGVSGLYDRRKRNGEAKVTDGFRRRVDQILRTTPEDFGWHRPTWTRELLRLQMMHEGWPEVAVCTMGRALAYIGARLGKPRPIVLCPWRRDQRERVLAGIRRLEERASAAEPVLYGDEVDIHLNPKIGRDWMPRGFQRRIVTPGKNEKFYIAGALDVTHRPSPHDRRGEEKRSALLPAPVAARVALSTCNMRPSHRGQLRDLHSARITQSTLAALRGRIRLHFLPPYCPDANRIERVLAGPARQRDAQSIAAKP